MSEAEKKISKRLYDIEYRKRNKETIRLKKLKYYQENKKDIYAKQKIIRDNDEYIKHLESEFMFSSSGTAKSVYELISSYKFQSKKIAEQKEKIEGWINHGESLQRKIDQLTEELNEKNQIITSGNYHNYGNLTICEEENNKLKEQLEEMKENFILFLEAMEIEKSRELVEKFTSLEYIQFGKLIATKTKLLTNKEE